jgi:hypoxanthine-guanine phosphoribosyltransferase
MTQNNHQTISANLFLDTVPSTAICWKQKDDIDQAVLQLAHKIKTHCQMLKTQNQQDVLFLSILGGPLYFAHHLFAYLQDLNFLHDFIQIIPNENEGVLDWRVIPQTNLHNKHVILLDELLDDGKTFASIIEKLSEWQISSIKTAVLCNKNNPEKVMLPDFFAFETPPAHIFGCGLSLLGRWGHLNSLYILPA